MSNKTVKAVMAELFEKEEFFQAISDGVEKKLGTILDRLIQQESRIAEIESAGKVKDAQIRDLETKLSSLETRCDRLESDLMDIQNGKDQREERLESLQTELHMRNEEVHSLKRSMNSLEQYSRRNCVRIFGIKEKSGENTDEIVCNVAQKIGITFDVSDIDRSHRVGKVPADKEKSRGIIAKFRSYKCCQQLILNRKKLKGMHISVFEDLTASNFKLLRDAQSCPKTLAAWSLSGRIYVSAAAADGSSVKHLITCKGDLQKL